MPHFVPFSRIWVWYGLFFAGLWGLLMWLITPSSEGVPLPTLAIVSYLSGIVFGLSMAAYYAHGRRKHSLPQWSELGRGGASR